MTATAKPAEAALPAGRLALRAAVLGFGVAAVLGGIAVGSGRLPEGTAPFVAAGALGALVTGSVGVYLKSRAVAAPPGAEPGLPSFQVAVLGDFVLQLFAVAVALLALWLWQVPFAHLAGFGIAFAAVVLALQFSGAAVLARALRRRSGSAPGAERSTVAATPHSAAPER
jgi:hypothetical protein